MTATRNPENKAVQLLRQGKAVYIWQNFEGFHVREGFRQLPEWLTRRGGIFAWDELPPELHEWMFERRFESSLMRNDADLCCSSHLSRLV